MAAWVVKAHMARMAKILPPSSVRAPPALWFVLLRASHSRTSGVLDASSPRPQNLLPTASLSRTVSQIITYPWAMELQQPLWFAYCYSQEYLDYLVSSMPCMATPLLAEESQAGHWNMQLTSLVLWSPGFPCQNGRIFLAPKH